MFIPLISSACCCILCGKPQFRATCLSLSAPAWVPNASRPPSDPGCAILQLHVASIFQEKKYDSFDHMNIDQEHLGPPMRVDPPQTRGARSCNFVLLQFFRRKRYDLSVYMNRSTLFQSPCPSILTPLSRSSKSITATTRVGGPETF